jgi:hypothetical protein
VDLSSLAVGVTRGRFWRLQSLTVVCGLEEMVVAILPVGRSIRFCVPGQAAAYPVPLSKVQ